MASVYRMNNCYNATNCKPLNWPRDLVLICDVKDSFNTTYDQPGTVLWEMDLVLLHPAQTHFYAMLCPKSPIPRQIDPVPMHFVINSFNTDLKEIIVPFDANPVLEWLSPLDPREKHRAIGINRVAGVGDWLLLTTQFTWWSGDFRGTAVPVLFCYGDPGVGKTYLRYG